MTECPLDMDRLTLHIGAAVRQRGGSATKPEDFYHGVLATMPPNDRASIVAHCSQHGCIAEFNKNTCGGTVLCIRAKRGTA